MALIGTSNEAKIWNYFKCKGLNEFGAAGLMGNLYAESALNPKNLQNTYEKKLGYTDEKYVTAVDSGVYKNFIKDSAGFGLAQWTFWSRKKTLYEYAKSQNASIGDLEMQLNFLYKELSESYPSVLSVLKNATSVLEASNAVLLNFERPADQSMSVQTRRAKYGQKYYDKFAVGVAAGETTEENVTQDSSLDNTPDTWAKEAVEWAVKHRILLGDERGNYKLHDACTRQEMLIFIKRMYDLTKG